MLTEQDIFHLLEKQHAVIRNSHIVYTSGKHGSQYVNKDAVYPHTELTSALCKEIAERFQSDPIDAVLAPAVGGIILSQWVAFHLTQLKGREILGVYAEKEGDSFVVKRGYDALIKHRNVLIVEDILTTGGSVKKVVEVLRALPCQVVGVGALCNRGSVTEKDVGNVPKLLPLVSVKFDSWEEADCELCKKQIPINTAVGKGREFLGKRK